MDLLGEEEGAVFCRYFDVTARGNFEGKNILNVPHVYEVDKDAMARGCAILFEAREERIKPGRDEKIQVSWNGMMISAFAQAYRAFGDSVYLDSASDAAKLSWRICVRIAGFCCIPVKMDRRVSMPIRMIMPV